MREPGLGRGISGRRGLGADGGAAGWSQPSNLLRGKGLLRRGRPRAASTVGQRVVVELAAEAAPAPARSRHTPCSPRIQGAPRRRPVSLTHLARAGCPSPGGTRRCVGRGHRISLCNKDFRHRAGVVAAAAGDTRGRRQRPDRSRPCPACSLPAGVRRGSGPPRRGGSLTGRRALLTVARASRGWC